MADPPTLTKEYILSRLLSDPAAGVLNGDFRLGGWHDDTSNPKPAAVLVPLVQHRHGTTVLLTQRTDHLHHHPGQVSFPGGRVEQRDASPIRTALRETEEEIGLASELVEVAGYLDPYQTVTGFRVIPVVGFVRPGFELELDSFEVARVFEVPLSFVLDPVNHERHHREVRGQRRQFYVLPYLDHYIWGATAAMLVNLYEKLMRE
jgi:8-oxo-dGTP pyrophosphatase MutT (NUDIX family)